MSNLILFVGNTDSSLSLIAQQYDESAVGIFASNLTNLDQIKVGYVSIGDHSLQDFISILDYALEIHYVHSDNWDDIDTKLNTECYLRYFSHRKSVYNFTNIPVSNGMLDLIDTRKINNSQLWTVGDSFTVGTPWVEFEQTYGYLLGKDLNLPVSCLAKGGASISWAADQILRSDIRKDDIVVWLLTSVHRFPYYYNDQLRHVYANYWEEDPSFSKILDEKILLSQHLTYLACKSIDQVIHDSYKVGYKLVITKAPVDINDNEFFMLDYLSNFNCFVHNYKHPGDGLIDYGNDGEHPGPKQHQHYVDVISRHLKK
jgi:hypothetical protein